MPELPMPVPEPNDESQEWLKELATKSWEPELIISAASIYLISSLPEWIDGVYLHYEINWAQSGYLEAAAGVGIELLASLGLLFFKCAAYMLTAAFVAHFTLRAFWVATIGLLSVFPQDIEYDRLPKLGDHAKKAMRIQLGTFQSFIVRLDRTCSTLLSIAFLIALSIANISIIYLAMFILLSFVRLVVPIGIMEEYEVVLYFVFLALTLLPAVFMGLGNTKWAKKRPDLETRLFRWQWAATGILFPFTRDPFTRLGYMFQSNISRSAYNRYKLLIGVTLSVLLLFFKLQHDAGNRLDTRTYYGTDEPYRVYPVHYDNLRTKGELIRTASIHTDVLKDNYLKLFIAYPKMLDAVLRSRWSEPILPDNMPREQARAKRNEANLAGFSAYFKIYVNDSLRTDPGFLWHTHPNANERGVLAYLSAKGFRLGPNQLRVTAPRTDSVGKEQRVTVIPFWYMP